jgi:hypothetical protein
MDQQQGCVLPENSGSRTTVKEMTEGTTAIATNNFAQNSIFLSLRMKSVGLLCVKDSGGD